MSLPNILSECARLTAGAGAGALASVARRHGSLPMSATAKMLITAGGARVGTVGGGCLEAEIIERALDVIERRVPAVSEHSLNAELAGDYGLTCGGTAVMLIEPVFPDDTLAAVYAAAATDVARGDRGVMATGLDWSDGPAKLYGSHRTNPKIGDAEIVFDLDPAAPYTSVFGQGPAALHAALTAYGDDDETPSFVSDMLVEPMRGKPRLAVFGGGHVGARIAEVAALAGWSVTVVDDRADFADARRLPFAERTIVCDFHDVERAVPLDVHSYAVIATRGHQHDVVLASQIAPLGLHYLGMLCSRRKVALTAKMLRQWDVTQEAIDAMHAPVGLAIGADTPEEIAVSVVAEMIAVRRSGTRRRGAVDTAARSESAT